MYGGDVCLNFPSSVVAANFAKPAPGVQHPIHLCHVGRVGAPLDVQDVIEIGDIANSQSEYLDLGEFLVRGQRGQ